MGRATPAISWAAMDLGPSPDVLPNVVPMMAGVERAFNSYRMCAVPSRDALTEDVSFEIHILDPALMTQPVYQEFAGRFKQDHEQWTHPSSRKQQRLGLGDLQATELTFGQLHKQPLVFLGGQRPARRPPLAGQASAAAEAGAASRPAISHEGFTPPLSLNSPTPESIKLLSKPSHQRWAGLQELLAMRRRSRPGVFLLSSPRGLITDIDAELRGSGGMLLAHIGLPLSHVVQLRGLLRQKHEAERAEAAAAAPG
ncbi:hypothetical protein OEZ85_013535 [Tetradesmus obliquus]|uniref:Uncharacterized protein n=1 Tax=Tetradesmus obliquus TaxID=3088 RepID=A0ABY8URZ6_TETOB|nr:hypothetical protein OEZ85_013535 [Tetradesmus obliquus]